MKQIKSIKFDAEVMDDIYEIEDVYAISVPQLLQELAEDYFKKCAEAGYDVKNSIFDESRETLTQDLHFHIRGAFFKENKHNMAGRLLKDVRLDIAKIVYDDALANLRGQKTPDRLWVYSWQ